MPIDPDICTTQQADLESWKVDGNGEVCRRVCDDEANDKLQQLVDGIVEASLNDPEHFNGSVLDSAAAIQVPSSAGTDIVNILIHNISLKGDEILQASFDGGTNYKTIYPGDVFIWTMGTGSALKQIDLKAKDKDTDFEIVMNREAV